MTCGVYKITIGDAFYIGSSRNLTSRERGHRLQLRKGTHHNQWMQRAWDKYGTFEFEVLEVCDASITFDIEQRYLDEMFDDPLCMNAVRDACHIPAWNHKEETLQRMSAASTGRYHTPETRARISQTHMGMGHTEETKAKMRKPKSAEHAKKCQENGMKTAGSRPNSTGYIGVSKQWNRYRASLRVDGKYIHVGMFDTPEEASAAYQAAKHLSSSVTIALP